MTVAARTIKQDGTTGSNYDVLVDNITVDTITGDAQLISGIETAGDAPVGRPIVIAGVADSTIPAAVDDGDVRTPWYDLNGALHVRNTPQCDSTWTDLVTQAAAFVANDQLCDEFELTGMSRVAGGAGRINNLVLFSNNLTVISAALWLYQVNPTAAGTNAVHNQTDANNETSRPLGVVYFTSWVTETDNMHAIGTYYGVPLIDGEGLPYNCLDGTNTTSLWGLLVTYTAVTPGATTDYNLLTLYTPGV